MTVHAPLHHPTPTLGRRHPLQLPRAARLLTWFLAAAAVVAAGGSLLFPGVLRGAAVTDGNLRGTALVVLVLGLPALLAGALLAARGSVRGLVVWLGAAAYLTYQGVMFSFGTPMNNLFLAYVAVLGLGIWLLVSILTSLDPVAVRRQVGTGMPYRTIGGLLVVVAGLNSLAWVARVLPPAFTDEPSSPVSGSGLLTSPVYVQDLAFWLPAALVAGCWMWSQRAWGVLLATALLTYYVLEAVSVASDQWWGVMADDSQPALASWTAVPGALVTAAVLAVALGWCLRNLDPTVGRDVG
jgi:hypothetical protein